MRHPYGNTVAVANFHVDLDRRSSTTYRAYVTPVFSSTSSPYDIEPSSVDILRSGAWSSKFGGSGDRWNRQNKLFSSPTNSITVKVNVKFENKQTGAKTWRSCYY